MARATPTARRTAYTADANTAPPTTTRTEKGVSLARGPALVLGTILTAGGLYFLYKAHGFPRFSNFPNGNARIDGKHFFGIFGINGWTGMLTAVAGALLLFGAAQHLLAKTMSLIVGLGLGAAAVIAAISGNVLGLAAANRLTELGWAVCALILLFNTLIPRRRHTVVVADGAATGAAPVRQPVVTRDADEPVVTRGTEERVANRGTEEPVVTRGTEEPAVTRADEQPTAVAPRSEQPATAMPPGHDQQATAVHSPYDEQPTAARPAAETTEPVVREGE